MAIEDLSLRCASRFNGVNIKVLWFQYFGFNTLVSILWFQYFGFNTLVSILWF
jgi:vancomycin permeability regulator SanA